MSATISEQYRCLVDILTCMVCKEMVKKAHICPNCSKFYCLDCIIRQLAIEETCLNCNKFLEVSMLVNCQKLCSELSETLEKVSIKKPQSTKSSHQKLSLYCNNHKLEKTYYCKTCDQPLCSDCSVLTENHRGHEFIKLSLMRNTYESKIHEKIDQINSLQKNIQKKLQLAQVIKHKKGTNNHQDLLKFQSSMKLLKQQLRKNLKKILNEGEKSLDSITQNLQIWNNKYQDLLGRLKNCSKGKFVQQQYEILQKQLNSVLQHIDSNNQNINNINLDIERRQIHISYINPSFQQFNFFVTDYTNKSKNQNFFYTDTVITKMGLSWRLKIYPLGTIIENQKLNIQNKVMKKQQKNQDTYFSIFLEFIGGFVTTTRQKYELTLVNQNDENKSFTRQFESEFDIGECWGYEHFIKLNQIYQEGFYNRENDCLEMVLKICSSNYFQAVRDQQAYITYKRQEIIKKDALIEKIEKNRSKKLLSTASLIHIDLPETIKNT